MGINRHLARSFLVAASLIVVATMAVGCTNSSHVVSSGSPTTSVSPVTGSSGGGELDAVVQCLSSQNVALPAGAKARQVRIAFEGLPIDQQRSVFAACNSRLSVALRAKIQAFIAGEESAPT